SCLRVTIVFLPDLPSMRIRIGKIDHDLTQALTPSPSSGASQVNANGDRPSRTVPRRGRTAEL
ncbi:hypothetical protein ABZW44_36000, partial [Streptomyces mirabilis]|uniref:hypothetical protein n=1 Tax=Streptomyces mirabilis TaxID=68239 RepID=UPI0033AAD281